MKRLVLAILCCLARFAPAQQDCTQVDGREIQGKDLAAAFAAFDALPKNLQLGPMPLPGSVRTFHLPELRSLAQAYAIRLPVEREACFEWPMESLDAIRVSEAMRTALAGLDAQVEVLEESVYRVPRGAIDFPRASLSKPASSDPNAPSLWRGAVVYGGGLRYAIWAKVRVSAACHRVVAAQPLKAGVAISTNQLRMESTQAFPDPDRCPESPAVLAGLSPVRPIPAGAEVRLSLLALPYDVVRGQEIEVTVSSGAARLALKGKAETSGRNGDLIAVRNPVSNRTFQARVNGKASAVVAADLPGGF